MYEVFIRTYNKPHKMKNLIVKVNCKGVIVNYISHPITDIVKLQHKVRIKQVIYGELFHVYHAEMNFTNCQVLIDNR